MKIPSRESLFSSCLSVSLRYKPFNSQREPCPALKCLSLTFESVNKILWCENSPSVRSGSKFTLLKFWKGYFWQNKLGDSSEQIIYNLNKHYLPYPCVEFVFFGGHFEFCGRLVRGLETWNIWGLGTGLEQFLSKWPPKKTDCTRW